VSNLPSTPSATPNTTTNTSVGTTQSTQGGASPNTQTTTSPQEYFPRCAVHLVVRFDEFGATEQLRAAAPTTTTKNLNGTTTNRSGLTAQVDPNSPPGVKRFLIGVSGPNVVGNGPQNRTQSSDGLTYDFVAIPKKVSWSQNGLRKASTCKLTLKYVDLPFDPRLARAVAVELILGCLSYEDAAAEASGDWSGQSAPIIPRTYAGPYGEPRTNVRFQGFVDSWENTWSEDEPLVELECTDNTQLLIDQEHSPRLVLDMTKPLDQAIAGYLANYVQFAGLTVEYRPSGDNPPILKNVLAGTAFRPNLGPQVSKGGGAGAGSKSSTWDYLTEVAGSIGHTVRMDGTNLVVQRARSIMVKGNMQRPDDPFTPRTIDGQSYEARALLYGRNLKKMTFKREFRRHAPSGVELRSYDSAHKKILVARFPKVSQDPKTQRVMIRGLPGNTQPDQKWTVIQVAGITDQPTLNRLAQDYYEMVGRQELAVSCETENMASFGGGNTDPDILDMKFGDEFLLFVDKSASGTVSHIERYLTASARAEALMTSLGFSSGFAAQYAQSYTNAGFQYAFRLHEMTVDWDESGCGIKLSGVNYVEVRADQLLPMGQEPGNTANQPQSTGATQS
jgi:hypothetical protein